MGAALVVWMLAVFACAGDNDSPPPDLVETTDTGSTDTASGLESADTAETADTAGSSSGLFQFDGPRPQHLLMISLDTLRRDRFTRYGGGGHMPWLDGMLEASVALDNHVACSNWTLHSTVCAMTGTYPENLGFLPAHWQSGVTRPPNGTTMLPTWLAPAGFHSMLATANPVFSTQLNNAQGFDEQFLHPTLSEGTVAELTGELLSMIGDAPMGARRYAHLHAMEPHVPYNPPQAYLGALDDLPSLSYDLTTPDGHSELVEALLAGTLSPADHANGLSHLLARYDGDTAWMDAQLSATWDELDARGLLDDTLVVFWTDHGEQFLEHENAGHGLTLMREENDAAMFFWAKNLAPARHDGLTSGIDMVPTVLELLQLDVPSSATGVMVGTAPSDRAVYTAGASTAGIFQAIVTQTHKLHFGWRDPAEPQDGPDFGAGVAVYSRAELPELVDLYDPADPVTLGLWNELLPYVRLMVPLVAPAVPAIPAELPQK